MGDLDDELKKALDESEAQAQAQPASGSASSPAGEPPAVSVPPSAEDPKRNLGLLIGLVVVAAGILTLVFTSVDDAAIYSVTTDQLVSQKDEYQDRNVRVEGDLVSGTLRQRKEPCEYRFTIEKNGKQLPVRYPACVVPDTFKDVPGIEVQVTAEGKLNSTGHFDATHIMAKCPSKYEMQQRAANGEEAPHDLMGGPPSMAADEE
jgi:cytochrome c-type biogenesis protein CcmE